MMNNPLFTDDEIDTNQKAVDRTDLHSIGYAQGMDTAFKIANRRCGDREKARDKQELEFLERFDIRTLDSIEVIDWNDEEIWADDYILNRIKEIQDRLTQSEVKK